METVVGTGMGMVTGRGRSEVPYPSEISRFFKIQNIVTSYVVMGVGPINDGPEPSACLGQGFAFKV